MTDSRIKIRKTSFGTYVAEVQDKLGHGFSVWSTESKTLEECQSKVDEAKQSYMTEEWMQRCLKRHNDLTSMIMAVDCRSIH